MTDSQSTAGEAGRRSDPLLTVVWWLLTVLLTVCLIAGAVGLLAYPLLQVGKGYVAAEFARTGIDASALSWLGVLGILVAAAMALTYMFLRHLRRIVESVAASCPFDPINADRLRAMAWLSVAIQLVGVPMTRLLVWFDAMPQEPNVHHNADGISVGGIVLSLVLFVLARVFRTGAEMQEDLEGTV